MFPSVLSGFLFALLAPWLHRAAGKAAGWVLALFPLGLAVYYGRFSASIAAGETHRVSYAWIPALGVELSFHLDGLSLLFVLMISGVGALVTLYASSYLEGHAQRGRFFAYIFLFMASMLGVALADNVITLFLFWELTSLTSFLLIGFDHERVEARWAALQALLVTGLGGLALLAGLVLLSMAGGSGEISTLLGRGDIIREHPFYFSILLLIFAGAFTKSAQWPFHFWLPNAMEAPAPVSAYLHSATMVKAGIYLLARFSPILGGTAWWHGVVCGVGIITMLLGAWLALQKTDMKRILAYSTLSVLGTLTFLIGEGSRAAASAMVVYLLAHSFYKGALFLVAGNVDHETGERNVERLSGLRRAMPVTAAAAFLAGLSMAGLPPLFGFIGKEMLFDVSLHSRVAPLFLILVVFSAGVSMIAVAALVGFHIFRGPETAELPRHPHEAPLSMWLGPAILAVLGLLFGLAPGVAGRLLFQRAADAVLGESSHLQLSLWHGFNPALGLSVLAVLCGLGVYWKWESLRRVGSRFEGLACYGPGRWYDRAYDGLLWSAVGQTRLLQTGSLRSYIRTIVLTVATLVGYTLARGDEVCFIADFSDTYLHEWILALSLTAAWVVILRARGRLTAVAGLGVIGCAMAMLFILFAAPDLSIILFTVDNLSIILFVLVLYRLPRFARYVHAKRHGQRLDFLVALALGSVLTAMMLTVHSEPLVSRLSPYFMANSYPLAHGRNIVNVILVDFRGLDTLGEITVLGIAGVGVYALLTLRPEKRKS